MMITNLPLHDAKLITLPAFTDSRGLFVKTFHDTTLQTEGVSFTLRESYFSTSKKNVIRGMHFQTPPHHHSKIVFCPAGAILDVIIDLRKGSPTYGQHHGQILSSENHLAYYIPEGFAHGFKSLTDDAMTYYLVSSEWNKDHDKGIRWNSIGFEWELSAPIISDRDQTFPTLNEFESPFA